MKENTNQAGKGSKPRNCFSKKFKDNYDEINWKSKSDSPAITIVYKVEDPKICNTSKPPTN